MPPLSHRASSAPMVPSSNARNDRSHIDAGDLCIGCIVWLPPRLLSNGSIRCSKSDCCGKELDDEGYEHPVVVLNIKQREGSRTPGDLICTVACVTTFGDTSLSSYLTKRLQSRHKPPSIPIYHPKADAFAADAIELVEQLRLENGTLRKQSYVKLQHTYEIPSSTLCQYNGGPRDRAYTLRLNQVSYNLLMERFGLITEEYVATARIPRTGEWLAKLARSGRRINRTRTEPFSPARPSYTEPYYYPYSDSYGEASSSHVANLPRAQFGRHYSTYRPAYDDSSNDNNDNNDANNDSGLVSTLVTAVKWMGLGWVLWKLFRWIMVWKWRRLRRQGLN